MVSVAIRCANDQDTINRGGIGDDCLSTVVSNASNDHNVVLNCFADGVYELERGTGFRVYVDYFCAVLGGPRDSARHRCGWGAVPAFRELDGKDLGRGCDAEDTILATSAVRCN